MGDKIKQLRKSKRMSQKQVADKIGIHQTYISFIERNVQYPSLMVAICLANLFNVSLDELCCRDFKGGK